MFRFADGETDDRPDDGVGVALLTGRSDDVGEYAEHDADDGGRGHARRFALIALAVVTVVVAVSITLVAALVDTSHAPGSPAAAAQQWAHDLVHGDTSGRQALECSPGRKDSQVLSLLLTDVSDARAGDAVRTGATRWRVPLQFLGPDGSAEAGYGVQVVRRSGRYLIC